MSCLTNEQLLVVEAKLLSHQAKISIRLAKDNFFLPEGASNGDAEKEFHFWIDTRCAEMSVGYRRDNLPAIVADLFGHRKLRSADCLLALLPPI